MTERNRLAELLAYILLMAMLLRSGLLALKMNPASDIFVGGIIGAIVPVVQAIARIGQSEVMNTMARKLAESVPPGIQRIQIDQPANDPIPVSDKGTEA